MNWRTRRRLRLRGRRLWLLVVLVAAAVALRDSVGVLLAIFALLVLVDTAVPVPGQRRAQADERFKRLVRKRGRDPERLEVFDDHGGWPRRELGIESIPIDSITGTVEHSKAAAFDRRFRPHQSCGGRWQQIWLAELDGIPLPPIAVYRVGGRHILRDGHHRVSAARDHGWSTIEAEVVELRSPASAEAAAA
jgi:hypothetical protein